MPVARARRNVPTSRSPMNKKPTSGDAETSRPAAGAENREMYSEVAALVGTLAKAFTLTESAAAAAIESGAMTLDFAKDANGNHFVAANFAGKSARVYKDAIKYTDPAGSAGPQP